MGSIMGSLKKGQLNRFILYKNTIIKFATVTRDKFF